MFAVRTAIKTSSLRTFKSSLSIQSRSVVTLKNIKYTAEAEASGAGRNGKVSSGNLNLNLALPKEMGGTGQGENPEQLFAMGYSSCLLGAIQAVARQKGKADAVKDAKIHAKVSIGEAEGMPGFGIQVDMKVEGVEDELLQAGHEFCPYSRILKHGAVVNVSKA
ncbi:OsmC-like protein [Dendrothele bispora CBS 962.96]|uniref:OsmC-like protein n=1 Tax=Dendrothele bispora (strain CBS 962.96) TaxID=1314807 RepID=A0A4S8LX25_DENBC|nr:OsmC-like protein [Dendrothele bispora CBS 962.96]